METDLSEEPGKVDDDILLHGYEKASKMVESGMILEDLDLDLHNDTSSTNATTSDPVTLLNSNKIENSRESNHDQLQKLEVDNSFIDGTHVEPDSDYTPRSLSFPMNQKPSRKATKSYSNSATGFLSFKDAAIWVLKRSDSLLTASQIVETALAAGILKTDGKTPSATLSAIINNDIRFKGEDSVFVKFGAGKFSTRDKLEEHLMNLLLLPFERELGMKFLEGSVLKYIPFEKESDWLEIGPTQLGKHAGNGLYTKYPIKEGTIVCEYRGEIRDNPPDAEETVKTKSKLYPYAVSVRMKDNANKMIDGLGASGEVLSLAPRINDAGPIFQNAQLSEYDEVPGKVFMVAVRDIEPGEELFACYGPEYWGLKRYPRHFKTLREWGNLPNYEEPAMDFYSVKRDGLVLRFVRDDKPLPVEFSLHGGDNRVSGNKNTKKLVSVADFLKANEGQEEGDEIISVSKLQTNGSPAPRITPTKALSVSAIPNISPKEFTPRPLQAFFNKCFEMYEQVLKEDLESSPLAVPSTLTLPEDEPPSEIQSVIMTIASENGVDMNPELQNFLTGFLERVKKLNDNLNDFNVSQSSVGNGHRNGNGGGKKVDFASPKRRKVSLEKEGNDELPERRRKKPARFREKSPKNSKLRPSYYKITVQHLLQHQLLNPGEELTYRDETSILQADGTVEFKGETFGSLSAWATHVLRSQCPTSGTQVNGWDSVAARGLKMSHYRKRLDDTLSLHATDPENATIPPSGSSDPSGENKDLTTMEVERKEVQETNTLQDEDASKRNADEGIDGKDPNEHYQSPEMNHGT